MKISLPSLVFASILSSQAQTLTRGEVTDWPSGYRVNYTVNNDTATATEGWVVTVQLGAGVTVGDPSNARRVPSLTDEAAGIFAFSNESYNGTLSAGGSTSFGFNVDPDNGTSPPETGTVTLNFDPADLPLFQVDAAEILEGDATSKIVEVTVRLSRAAAETATVNYATISGTATAGEDFENTSGTLTFAAGELEKTVSVTILGDLTDEGDETFSLTLSEAEGAAIGTSSGTITITENDIVPDLAISDASAFENGGTLSFTVTLTPPSSSSVSVNYLTSEGTATAGTDYATASGSLTFAPGDEAKTITIDLLDDSEEELPETFQITLSGAVGIDLARSVGTGTILDDERTGTGKPQSGLFNYAEVLQKTMYFYEAQRSGDLPETNRVSWRADSCLEDGSDVGRDLTGGWFDAGDHVKFGFPMANSATILAWGGLEFQEGYLETGQFPFLLDNLRWVCDYFLKCHERDATGATTTYWGQVANGGVDHSYWGSPELYPLERPSYKIDRMNPGTDLACETAAALASCSILFRSTAPGYADTLLEHARALYDFGDTYRGVYSESITDAVGFYNSFSGFEDELLWGALWLHRATGEQSYLDTATALFNAKFPTGDPGPLTFGPSWDDKNYGAVVMMAQVHNTAFFCVFF